MATFRTIVVGVDFSEASASALDEACRLAALDKGRVIAVEVVEREVLEDQIRYHRIAAEQAVEAIHQHLLTYLAEHGAGQGVEARVIIGHPYNGLLDVVAATGADLLVLGSRGWHHSPGTVGTVAAKCVRHAQPPVLLVRARHHAAFRHIVACVDFSHCSATALVHAMEIARKEHATIDVVHVDFPVWMQPVHVQYDLLRPPGLDYRQACRSAVREKMAAWVDAVISPLGPGGPEARVHVLEDIRTADAIARFLHEQSADLMVLCTLGRSGANAILLGTTAERLLHRSACSALVIKPGNSHLPGPGARAD